MKVHKLSSAQLEKWKSNEAYFQILGLKSCDPDLTPVNDEVPTPSILWPHVTFSLWCPCNVGFGWSKINHLLGGNQIVLLSGTLLILILQYWIIGALYSWMDLTLKPRALRKYKIQPATNEPLEKKKLIQVKNGFNVMWNYIYIYKHGSRFNTDFSLAFYL